jgi:hypothetical protein
LTETMSGYTIKGLLFELIPEAAEAARGRYESFSQRDLYYTCRSRYLASPKRPHSKEYRIKRGEDETDAQYEARREAARRSKAPIDYKYFTTKILRAYERQFGEIEGLIREPYGVFVEPYSGNSVQLGTKEVIEYTFPEHTFDKVLLVEKQTERTKFEADRIAEKYDMAIVYSRGYATQALQQLLKSAEDGDYQIFTWHDADVDGYNIARNLRAETENIPGITLEIIDIGLTVEEALRIGCDSEPFEDDDELPGALRATLTDLELEYFGEHQIRFEINGIDPDDRIGYVEEQLKKHGVRPKYVPPADVLRDLVDVALQEDIDLRVRMAINEFVDTDGIVTRVTEAFMDRLRLEDPAPFVRQKFEERPYASWEGIASTENRRRVREVHDEIMEMVRDEIVTMVTEDEENDV